MLYQRYFLRMNQSNMTHVLGLLAGLAFALGMLLMLRLVVEDSQQFLATLERPENLSLAVTLVICVAIYAGKYQKIKRRIFSARDSPAVRGPLRKQNPNTPCKISASIAQIKSGNSTWSNLTVKSVVVQI